MVQTSSVKPGLWRGGGFGMLYTITCYRDTTMRITYPYNATFFNPLSLGAYDARDMPGDCVVEPRPRRQGSPQSYTHAEVTRLRIIGGAATPSALALFSPKTPFKCHRKKCANIVSTIWSCQPAYFPTDRK